MQAVDPKNKTRLVFSIVGSLLLLGLIGGLITTLVYAKSMFEAGVAQPLTGQNALQRYNFDQVKALGVVSQ